MEAVLAEGLRKVFVQRRGGLLRGRRERVVALDGVSFRVGWGEVYCLLGPNGAGKTTTIRVVSTLLLPDEGEAYVAGYSCIREPRFVRRVIGVMLSVERGFFWKLTGRENLKYFGLLYGLEGRKLEERIDEVLGVTGLKELGGDEKKFEDMSLGMKARLGLARALLKDPSVLILDEPTLGLDPASARSVRGLLREIAGAGKAVLVTTHNMFEAERICDRVGIIVKGRIRVEGSVEELKGLVSDRVPIVLKLRGEGVLVERLAGDLGGLAVRGLGGSPVWNVRVLVEPSGVEEVVGRALESARALGLRLVEARVEEPSLEDVFLRVAGGGVWE